MVSTGEEQVSGKGANVGHSFQLSHSECGS